MGMKTPDEIKKGLIEPELFCSHCEYSGEPHGCNRPNGSCKAWDNADDAYRLIQQLEATVSEKEKVIAELSGKVGRLEAERDAAVEDIRLTSTLYVGTCQTCKHCKNQVDCDEPEACGLCKVDGCPCRTCGKDDRNWEWRGVQKEE